MAAMGRRLELVTALAESVVTVCGAMFVLAGLVPMLWEHDGWSGAVDRSGSLMPLAVATALGAPAGRAWRARRARRRAADEQAVTAPSELEGE